MDFHPELKMAFETLRQIWPWIAGSGAILLLFGGIVWKLWPVSYIHTSLKSAVAPYSADNVSRWTIYHVWSSSASRGQEFVVLKIVDDYLFVAVLKHNWIFKKRSDQRAFEGWIKVIPHDQLIDSTDLLRQHPNDSLSPIDKLMRIGFN